MNLYPYMAVLLSNNNQVDTPYVTVKGGATISMTTLRLNMVVFLLYHF